MLGGPGEAINLMPQSGNFNQGAWSTMENTLRRTYDNPNVKHVSVKVKLTYGDTKYSQRPTGINAWTNIDGKITSYRFNNAPGGK